MADPRCWERFEAEAVISRSACLDAPALLSLLRDDFGVKKRLNVRGVTLGPFLGFSEHWLLVVGGRRGDDGGGGSDCKLLLSSLLDIFVAWGEVENWWFSIGDFDDSYNNNIDIPELSTVQAAMIK